MKNLRRYKKGLANTVSNVGIALVVTFVVLYIINMVADMTSIDSTSEFYSIYTTLTDKSATVFNALVLLIIIAVLAIVIWYVRSKMTAAAGVGGTAAV